MSEPVNHAETIREALTNITNGQVQGLSWYAVALAQQSHAKSALASLAAMQKELERAQARETLKGEATTEAMREREDAYATIAALQKELEEARNGRTIVKLQENLDKRDATITAQADRIARLEEALGTADDALATIHDVNALENENEPTDWTRRVDEMTSQAFDAIRAALTPPTP